MMSTERGQPADRESGAGERVRFCLECGEVLPFDAVRCPGCGTLESQWPSPAAPASTTGQLACPACGASRPANLLFCPRCGADVGATTAQARHLPAAPAEPQGAAVAALVMTLAILAPLCGVLVVLQLLLPGGLS